MTNNIFSKSSGGRLLRAASVAGLLLNASLPAVQVDSELVVLVDVSRSVNGVEHRSILESIAQTFESAAVIDSVSSGVNGRIAASLVFFSGQSEQSVGVSWLEISDASSAAQFASLVRGAVRPFSGASAIGSALAFATTTFGTETGGVGNGFESDRQAVTVYADGRDNDTGPGRRRQRNLRNSRDAALAAGVDQISAVVVNNPNRDLGAYYERNVIGGSGLEAGEVTVVELDLFSQPAVASSFSTTISSGSISVIPEPSSLAFLGLSGLLLFKRKRFQPMELS